MVSSSRIRPVKYVLLTFSRSGSSVLAAALRDHRQITMFGEVFHDDPRERPQFAARGVTYDDAMDGAAYLRRCVFGGTINGPVGFKMFYFHARRSSEARRAWDYLVAQRDVHVVHLVRTDLLACAISHLVAERTDRWLREPGEPAADVEPFAIDPEWLNGFFEHVTAWRLWADETFRRHPVLRVEYEADLCADFDGAVRTVHGFLGVQPCAARPRLAKVNVAPPREVVLNYDALAEHFRHTLFARFFE